MVKTINMICPICTMFMEIVTKEYGGQVGITIHCVKCGYNQAWFEQNTKI